ncbi:MAG: hypothetical protein K9M51_02815, partial [Candidatus Gracilibacteria bacterium]|nr:hypothetical protein [Candidatus Gracilibacteria bacterium]
MKKILLVFICGFFFFGAPLYAQGTPGEIEVDFSVKNVSRDNQDGTAVSARPGDVLRYELQLSDEIAATDVQPRVNMSDVLTQANMVSNGGGALETGDLVFPMFSSVEICGATCPNWQKQYSYFVR